MMNETELVIHHSAFIIFYATLCPVPFLQYRFIQLRGFKARNVEDAFVIPRSSRKVHHFRYALVS
jgi:hypothetical protein